MNSGDRENTMPYSPQQTFYIPPAGTAAGPAGQEEMPGDASYIENTGATVENNPNTTHTGAFEVQQAQESTEHEPTAQELEGIDDIRGFIDSLVSYGQEGREGHNDDHTGQVTATSYEGLTDNKANHTNSTAEELSPKEAAEVAADIAIKASKYLDDARLEAMSGDTQ